MTTLTSVGINVSLVELTSANNIVYEGSHLGALSKMNGKRERWNMEIPTNR